MSKEVTIDWCPDKSSKTALVHQIVQYITKKVYRGDWLIGDRLPTQRALAVAFDVNRSTISTAISELTISGVLETTVGKGTYVANNTWSLLVSDKTPNWKDYIEKGFHQANLPTIQAINKYEFDDDIIRLSTGEVSPELMPQDLFSEIFQQMSSEPIAFNYLEPLGLEALRTELCHYLKKHDIHITEKEILIVSGSLQALQLVALALLGKHSKVFVEEYSYVKSLKVFEFSGINMKTIATDNDGPLPWIIDTSTLREGTSILYTIPTFHNPTGRVMSHERRVELLKWCQKNHLPIIEDDAYRELYFDVRPPKPIKSMDTSGNVLYLGSFSKSLAPGIRIGWIVGPESVIERLGDIKMQTDYGASSVSQWMMTYMLRSGLYEEHLIQLRTRLKERCHQVLSYLDTYFSNIATWHVPKGGFYIWLKLNRAYHTDTLFENALKNKVLINPGFIYTSKNSSHIRISYSYASMADMEKGLQILSKIIREL
ncbi:MAG: PLP-dependent aminotransferase family protein [Clostridia bacterium]|nr:PLP-dependent aminotransferase family protein [Clostridia bacterium]